MLKSFKCCFVLGLLLLNFAHAEIKNNGDEDVLSSVSLQLSKLEKHLMDQRVFVSPAVLAWPELEQFNADLMFVVAHDPNGSPDKDTPIELSPKFLTEKLKKSWIDLRTSVLQLGDLAQNLEWVALEAEMGQFFKLREELYYQSARAMIKSGLLTDRTQKIKENAIQILKSSSDANKLSVRIVDPFIEKMTSELTTLNRSLRQLKEFRTPPVPENPSLFRPKYFKQLSIVIGIAFVSGIFLTMTFFWLKSKMTKRPVEIKQTTPPNSFNYYEWLKRLEANLQSFKTQEEKVSEQYIQLKDLAFELGGARKGLNLADNQQDYYISLDQLNASAPKIEEYFEKVNLKKQADISRKLIGQIVQLCDAIENKKEINFDSEKPQLRFVKLEQASHLKVA